MHGRVYANVSVCAGAGNDFDVEDREQMVQFRKGMCVFFAQRIER